MDERGSIIYSKRTGEIGKSARVLGAGFAALPGNGRNDNGGNLTVSSASGITGWRAVTVIPKKELLSIVYETVTIIAISLLVLLLLSIFTSARIAKTVMKPLAELNSKMKLVSQGNLDVSFETQYGEIGKISNTVDHMLKFEVVFDVDPEVLRCRTLKFLLQPLIENAVFHGFDSID